MTAEKGFRDIIEKVKQKEPDKAKECKVCGTRLGYRAEKFCDSCRTLSRSELAEIIYNIRKQR